MDSALQLTLSDMPAGGGLSFNYEVDPQPGNVLQVRHLPLISLSLSLSLAWPA
jgi:hypothetical protein